MLLELSAGVLRGVRLSGSCLLASKLVTCGHRSWCRSNTFQEPLEKLTGEYVAPKKPVDVFILNDGILLVGPAVGPDAGSVETRSRSKGLFGSRKGSDVGQSTWIDFVRMNTVSCHANPLYAVAGFGLCCHAPHDWLFPPCVASEMQRVCGFATRRFARSNSFVHPTWSATRFERPSRQRMMR